MTPLWWKRRTQFTPTWHLTPPTRMFCAGHHVSETLSGSSFQVLLPHDYPQISLSWTEMAIWQNSVPRGNFHSFSQCTKQEGYASTHDPTCLRECKTFSSAFHRLSPARLFLKTKQPSLPGTFAVTPQRVWSSKKTWSHLLVMPLLRLQRLQKNPQVLRHCVRRVCHDSREERDWSFVRSCGHGLGPTGNAIPQRTSLGRRTLEHDPMHPQNSSFKIWRDANILLHT